MWKQAAIASTVEVLVRDVGELKMSGTPNFRAYQLYTDERVATIKTEVSDLKRVIERVALLELSINMANERSKNIEEKLDEFRKAFDDHKKELIK